MFGSEKQKRALSAAKRNRVESDVLETALATAVTHAQNEIEKMSTGQLVCLWLLLLLMHVCVP